MWIYSNSIARACITFLIDITMYECLVLMGMHEKLCSVGIDFLSYEVETSTQLCFINATLHDPCCCPEFLIPVWVVGATTDENETERSSSHTINNVVILSIQNDSFKYPLTAPP